MCLVQLSQATPNIFPRNTGRLVIIMEADSVVCAVGNISFIAI